MAAFALLFFLRFVLDRCVHVAIHEIRDGLNGPRNVEVRDGSFAQVVGDAGDAVAFLDGVAHDGQIAAVESDQRDVGPVQGGHERQMTAARGEHLPRQQRRNRVRNRVVHVQQIERVVLRHFGHARGQRQIVRRKLEERVTGDGNLVIEDAVVAPAQAEWLRVGDEVDLVAESGQLDAQLRGDNAGASVGGITRDPDAHDAFLDANFRAERYEPLKRIKSVCF